MTEEPESTIAWFTTDALTVGKTEPVFIVKVPRTGGDHYYLTKVVWEYPPTVDPKDPLKKEREAAIAEVVNIFGRNGPDVDAREIGEDVSGLINGQAGK